MAAIERRSLVTLKNLGKLESKGWLADAQGRLGCSLAFLGEEETRCHLASPEPEVAPGPLSLPFAAPLGADPMSQGKRDAGGASPALVSSKQAASKQ